MSDPAIVDTARDRAPGASSAGRPSEAPDQGAREAIAAAVAGELRLMDPEVRTSRALARELLDPEFVEIGASGRRWTYEEMLHALPELSGSAPAGPRYRPSGMTGALLAPGIVLLTYETVIEGARARRSSLWRRAAGTGWRMYHHQATPAPALSGDGVEAGPQAGRPPSVLLPPADSAPCRHMPACDDTCK